MGDADWQKIFPSSTRPELEFFRFFSLAVELVCADKALCAVHELRVAGEIELQAVQEHAAVSDIVSEFPALANFAGSAPSTFVDLARLCRNAVRRMNEATGRGHVSQIIGSLPAREPYELLGTLCERLSGILRFRSVAQRPAPGFKFCLDDCEVLSANQLLSVNTLVRKSRFPVSWVICSVGDVIEGGETFIKEQPLTDADRRVVSLDERGNPEFFTLCEAVASLRTYFSLPAADRPPITAETIATQFSLTDKLGRVGVNDLLQTMLARSTSPLARQIISAARRLSDIARISDTPSKGFLIGSTPPYYQAYLLWHWTGREDAFVAAADAKDMARIEQHFPQLASQSFQAWLRRKMVGAFLHIGARLGFRRLPLAGAGIVTSLADGSIRDFLEIMADIFDAVRKENSRTEEAVLLRRFVTSRTKVAASAQTAGIYAASEQFFDGVGALTDASSTSMARLIEALAKYTSRLQTSTDDPSVLATTERGVFVLEGNEYLWLQDDSVTEYVRQVVNRADLSGYLRTVTLKRRAQTSASGRSGGTVTGFRLHRRFAPRFMFSYRGAYEPVRISTDYLATLCVADSDTTPTLGSLGSRQWSLP